VSQQNLDLTYQAVAAFNGRDLDAFLALADPDMEHVALGGEAYRGHDDVPIWWEETFSDIGDLSAEIQALRDFGDAVLVTVRVRGHGTSSRVPFDQTIWSVIEWHDGKVIRWSTHLREADALESVQPLPG